MREKKLNHRQERFVEEYLVDLNATAAARRAGYSEKTATRAGYANMSKTHVQAAINERRAAQSARTQITADDVLNGLKELARRSMGAPPYEYDPKSALRAYELIGRHLGMFSDRLAVTGADGAPLIPQPQTIRVHFDPPPEAEHGN